MRILMNQIGYECGDTKKILCQSHNHSDKDKIDGNEELIDTIKNVKFLLYSGDEICLMEWDGGAGEKILDWGEEQYWSFDFSKICEEGTYFIEVIWGNNQVKSQPFEIRESLHTLRLMNAIRCYFKSQRSSGEWLHADRELKFQGDKTGVVDLHGGWFDATGDYGIHLSHLSHTGLFNPNQSSFPAYICLETLEHLENSGRKHCEMLKRHLLDEAMVGADYIMRLKAPSGTFYRSVERGDAFSKVLDRQVDYETLTWSGHPQEGIAPPIEIIKDKNYEVGFRSGGGICIAVLAMAARYDYPGTDYQNKEYLQAGKDAFAYLIEHNEDQISDGKWNLLDDYTALIASVQLFKTTNEERYLVDARVLVDQLLDRIVDTPDGKWFESTPGNLFFHPADEGMPILALLDYSLIERDQQRKDHALMMAKEAIKHVCNISRAGSPFGYARFCRNKGNQIETRFFFPHDTVADPWWQGENARIASLSAVARKLRHYTNEPLLKDQMKEFADRQIDWILGCNPYDACMVDGFGRNNIQYFYKNQYDFMNCPGGVCNGITSGFDDTGIAFVLEPIKEVDDNWRWAEQWLPHGCWFLMALAYKE